MEIVYNGTEFKKAGALDERRGGFGEGDEGDRVGISWGDACFLDSVSSGGEGAFCDPCHYGGYGGVSLLDAAFCGRRFRPMDEEQSRLSPQMVPSRKSRGEILRAFAGEPMETVFPHLRSEGV